MQKQTQKSKLTKEVDAKPLYYALLCVFVALTMLLAGYKVADLVTNYFKGFEVVVPTINIPKKVENTTIYTGNMTVRQKIRFYATVFGVNKNDAERIAQCESNFRADIKNPLEGSTASGVYQFINRTWARECGGDVMNEDHNIICFMQQWPKHKSWWECK